MGLTYSYWNKQEASGMRDSVEKDLTKYTN